MTAAEAQIRAQSELHAGENLLWSDQKSRSGFKFDIIKEMVVTAQSGIPISSGGGHVAAILEFGQVKPLIHFVHGNRTDVPMLGEHLLTPCSLCAL